MEGKMQTVHVYAAIGRFKSWDEIQEFIHPKYDENGDAFKSKFMESIGMTEYEPMCIETIHSPMLKRIHELLRGVSYESQWATKVDPSIEADSVICVYEPNIVTKPNGSELRYCGAYTYDPNA
jgi:hypothetical protein